MTLCCCLFIVVPKLVKSHRIRVYPSRQEKSVTYVLTGPQVSPPVTHYPLHPPRPLKNLQILLHQGILCEISFDFLMERFDDLYFYLGQSESKAAHLVVIHDIKKNNLLLGHFKNQSPP